MKIRRVTFSGIDETVSAKDAIQVINDIPGVPIEYGILLSKSSQGKLNRYPSLEWVKDFISESLPFVANDKIYLAGHFQGFYLRNLGAWDFPASIWPYLQRIQLNFHGVPTEVTEEFWLALHDRRKQFIFQMDGVNEQIYHKAVNCPCVDIVPLYDASAGAGIVPEQWREPLHPNYNGYAGGLGPGNLREQLPLIAAVCGDREIWIDMETRIRNEMDIFDLDKVREVMIIVKEWNKVKTQG